MVRITIIGGHAVPPDLYALAEEIGLRIAQKGWDVVCGGLTGVMEAVCKGAREAGGHTIGIIPTSDRRDANRYVEIPIVTGIGFARNLMVVLNGDAVLAIDGSYGTLSEIGFALLYHREIVGIRTYAVEGVRPVETAADAVAALEEILESERRLRIPTEAPAGPDHEA